jgi:cytoskeletal protein CcmA (bactofilin family)
MAMFDKRKDSDSVIDSPVTHTPAPAPTRVPESTARTQAVIGKTVVIKGDISGEENLIVEGKVDGNIVLKNNDLTIGASGRVTANLTANVVKIEGEVKGDIKGLEKVVVTRTGKVNGNIVGPRVTLEDGAKFKGSIDMDPDDALRNESSTPARAMGRPQPSVVHEGTNG